MKSSLIYASNSAYEVAPLVGAWIEIHTRIKQKIQKREVAPLVGAWIEIEADFDKSKISTVAPLVGAWIEIGGKTDD